MDSIKSDKLIIKFSLYGFLKNLKFFEPFLIIYLMSLDWSLLHIGLLYSIREIINYIFEVPSGIFADHYGKKTELALCFSLYIISFVLFFMGGSFFILSLAMVFFGLGEAFRSGTHKAIIMEYLEEKGWFAHKNFVYGRTRSFSLLGSSIASFASIIFLLSFSNLRMLFLFCIIPYILDFILIMSYPKRFNKRHLTNIGFRDFFSLSFQQLKSIGKNRKIIKTVLSSSLFDAIVKGIKDYIQPILQALILASSVTIIRNLSQDDFLTISLAVIYGFVYILSSMASRNVYKLNKFMPSSALMNIFMYILAAAFFLLSFFIKINAIYAVIFLYFIIYILKDARRPVFVDTIGDIMDKKQRVTVLSIDSQLRAFFLIILAPAFGFIADTFSISALFLILGILSFGLNLLLSLHPSAKS